MKRSLVILFLAVAIVSSVAAGTAALFFALLLVTPVEGVSSSEYFYSVLWVIGVPVSVAALLAQSTLIALVDEIVGAINEKKRMGRLVDSSSEVS